MAKSIKSIKFQSVSKTKSAVEANIEVASSEPFQQKWKFVQLALGTAFSYIGMTCIKTGASSALIIADEPDEEEEEGASELDKALNKAAGSLVSTKITVPKNTKVEIVSVTVSFKATPTRTLGERLRAGEFGPASDITESVTERGN